MGMSRMAFAAGFAAGYVVGARAGREKYDQIVKLAKQTAEHPAVQQAAGTVQAQASGIAQKVGGQLQDKVPQMAHSAAHSVGGHIAGMRHRNGNGAASPEASAGASPFSTTTDSGLGARGTV